MRHQGTIIEWNDARGFGFIEPALGGERVFFHISAVRERTPRPAVRQRVTFELVKDRHGQPRARVIRYPVSGRPPMDGASEDHSYIGKAITGAAMILAVLARMAATGGRGKRR
jgi:cold shock CspA family protein